MLFVLLLALSPGACLAREIPKALRFTQETVKDKLGGHVYVLRTKPKTANPDVTREIGALVDEMLARARREFSTEPADPIAYLDVGPVISRTGDSWMSFLTLAEISRNKEHLYVDYDARVFDMETGQRVYMTDLFDPDSRAWDIIAYEAWNQLSRAFPTMTADENILDALCCREALENAQFTLGVGRLVISYRADALYPGKNTLLHVVIPYMKLRPYMTETAQRQTDNSGYKLCALTFDDGGGRDNTRGAMEQLRLHGAQATFFIVGSMMPKNHDILAIQQDRICSMQTHTYSHLTAKEAKLDKILEEKARFDQEMSEEIGVVPTLMRVPGGDEEHYQKEEVGYPLIHWSLVSLDDRNVSAGAVAVQVSENIVNNDIVLLHDINKDVKEYMKRILRELDEQGFLCVTVEELYDRAGVELLPGYIYYSPKSEPIPPPWAE